MKRTLLFSIFTLLCFVFAYVLLTFEKYNRQSFRHETDSQQSKIINSLENTSCIRNNSTNFFVYRGADKKSRIIDRPKTQGKQSSVLTDYEIDYEYPPETPVGMQEIQHAISHGAVGKITLRVVDSVGLPVEQANIYAWFYNGSLDKKIETSTDFEGFASLEAKNKGYVQFTITKKGYYSTGWRYWFIQRFCDTIQSNRWIPWNPTLEVVLKEKRNPQKMVSYQNTFRGKSFPNNQKIGFDLEKNDFVAPFGKGVQSDFTILYELNPSTNSTRMKTLQRCTITVNSNDGIASIKKDYFSDSRFPYNTNHLVFQPMTQYLCWINNDNELINNFPTRSDGLILRTRTQLDDSGMITSVVYSVITRIELQSYEKETELLLRYYSNSEDNNLEILQDETYIIE